MSKINKDSERSEKISVGLSESVGGVKSMFIFFGFASVFLFYLAAGIKLWIDAWTIYNSEDESPPQTDSPTDTPTSTPTPTPSPDSDNGYTGPRVNISSDIGFYVAYGLFGAALLVCSVYFLFLIRRGVSFATQTSANVAGAVLYKGATGAVAIGKGASNAASTFSSLPRRFLLSPVLWFIIFVMVANAFVIITYFTRDREVENENGEVEILVPTVEMETLQRVVAIALAVTTLIIATYFLFRIFGRIADRLFLLLITFVVVLTLYNQLVPGGDAKSFTFQKYAPIIFFVFQLILVLLILRAGARQYKPYALFYAFGIILAVLAAQNFAMVFVSPKCDRFLFKTARKEPEFVEIESACRKDQDPKKFRKLLRRFVKNYHPDKHIKDGCARYANETFIRIQNYFDDYEKRFC